MGNYEINGKTYFQKPLVLGQLVQLSDFFESLSDVPREATINGLIKTLGDKLPLAIAIVLCEEGKSLRDKDVKALATEFAEHLSLEVAGRIVEDFFVFNPPTSLSGFLERTAVAVGAIGRQLTRSASSSQAET